MEASTTIQQMLSGNKIFVPTYQRAYSWDTELEKSKSAKQVNTFLDDLEDYIKSSTQSRYYFGHFLFEEKDKSAFGIIDGQQRMTTIVIFLSVLFKKLESIRPLTEEEEVAKEDMVIRKSVHRFETVDYDKQLFKDYVIEQIKKDKNGLETESAKRIVTAFDFFSSQLAGKDEQHLLKMLDTIQNASCTTHPVIDESEAIQMFIFQNNRGKKPSNLEIIKAQFMFNVHLYGGEEKEVVIEEIKNRFEKIYKSISTIEYRLNEDDVLGYTLRVYFNSLWEENTVERINKMLSTNNPIPFIREFTQSLSTSFEHLVVFFGKDEKSNIEIHSLVTLGKIGVVMPFVIKAYKFGLPINQINLLCSKLESMVLRHRLIGTRAELESRLNEVYKAFTEEKSEINSIIEKIEWMKTVSSESSWWSYWNNEELDRSVQGEINPSIAKHLLWKYENYLQLQGHSGYKVMRFDEITNPELEHIAPQTPSDGKKVATGYPKYTESFINQFIDCLGNYLLVSKSHNCSIGNQAFPTKRDSYTHLEQQREIQRLTLETATWTTQLIKARKDKIINFLIDNI